MHKHDSNKRLYDAVTYLSNAATQLEIVVRRMQKYPGSYRALANAINKCDGAVKSIESRSVRKALLAMRP